MSSINADSDTGLALQRSCAAQPVFDADKKRFAIELLQRSKTGTKVFCLNDASPSILLPVCQQLSDYLSLYHSDLFIRLSAQLLEAKVTLALDPSRVIIALAAPVKYSKTLLAAIGWYKNQGFRFLLDDSSVSAHSAAVIALADIVRIDMKDTSLADAERLNALYGRPGLQWLADRVETEAQFQIYKSLGCELFQGYFFPDKLEIAGKKIEPSAVKLADIISCLFDPEPDLNKLAAVLQDEPSIVMGMLKVANSPLYRKTREVSSIKEVVTRLGLELSRKLVLTYAVLNSHNTPAAVTVLTRAYSAQSIARQWQFDAAHSQQYFLAALISGADMLFGVSPQEFLAYLNVPKQIADALSHNGGPMAEALALLLKIERGSALKLAADNAELPYISLYNIELAEVQQRLAQVL
ncbi:HDOD domain-containing protein [Rheinheimera muenzenbergensis]|uniref:HDOD domain-containing protein n=1 Tax=Rheinheimera muenzenbergensis TaxID=1193628 RepID=A0ABU8C9G4_9GAMM